MMNRYQRVNQGMTLIELMIVVAIIGILSAIAYPSYQNYVAGTYRTAASSCMVEIAHVMEREYSSEFSYENIAVPQLQCVIDLGERYSFALTNQAARTYQIVATPTATQIDECGILLLNQAGRKGAKNGFDPEGVANCW